MTRTTSSPMATVPELMSALEVAYDEFASARMAHAKSKANYERARLGALARSEEKSQAARQSEADIAAIEERTKLLRAEALAEITKVHVTVLLGELVAAQSLAKFAGKIDGGDW